jgi:hypothetical protein
MTPRIALLHATAAGSTTGIAERIHEVLAAAGYAVRAEQLIAERPLDPPDADAVVIGSAVHDMAWLPPALDALVVLAAMDRIPPLWCFSVGGVQPHGVVTRALAAQEIRRVEASRPACAQRIITSSAGSCGSTGCRCGAGCSTGSWRAAALVITATGLRSSRGRPLSRPTCGRLTAGRSNDEGQGPEPAPTTVPTHIGDSVPRRGTGPRTRPHTGRKYRR